MKLNLQTIAILFLVNLMVFDAPIAMAQGFKKLKVDDKYGQSGDTSTPIQPKSIDSEDGSENDSGTAPDGMIYLNGTDVDIKEMIQQMSALTGKNFIINDKIRGKITIISDKPMTKEMAYQAFLSALEINGFTTVMTPAGLLNVIPQKDSISKPTDLYKGASPVTDLYITRIIQMENISANEITQVIKPMVSKNGNMFAYPTTNSIIITDTGSNIDHILKLIKELDREGPQEILDMIPIVNADAKDIADKITQVFEKEAQTSTRGARSRRRRGRTSGAELQDVQNISKVIADERTNSILIMGTKRSLLKVRALIAKLDRSIAGAEGRIHVYYLRYAKSKDVATVLSNLVGDSKSANTKKGGKDAKTAAAGSAVTLEGGVKVTADESTNSLIVVASPKDYKTLVDNVIRRLDLLRPQVYLESVIMSLDVQKTKTIGVSGFGGLINTLAGGNQMNAFGGILPISPTAISTIAGASGGFGGGVISTDTIDFTLGDGSTASIPAVSGIITALASDVDANVLSTPSIMTLDNEEAEIQVGQEVPIPSGTTVSSGVTTFDVSREDTGIILKITPQISENDTVRLTISQEITSVFTSDPNLGPTLDKKSVNTVVLAKNKQTVVIGGLIDDKASISTQKVPLLGDIPVLGSLFRNRVTSKQKSNLLVFITPYIIRERKDYLSVLKRKIEERNHFIDMNYGRSQRKIIRRAISDHANDLLEFKCIVPTDENPCLSAAVQPSHHDAIMKAKVLKKIKTSAQKFGPEQKIRYRN